MSEEKDSFNSTRAELFEALGHPTRVRILRALDGRPMGFSELKREVGIESSGHLQFHLGKLAHLVGTTAEGFYALTDDGKEALRMLRAESERVIPKAKSISIHHRNWREPLLAGLLIAVIVLGVVAVYQQQQIATLNRELDTNSVVINGTRYWYESVPVGLANGTGMTFHGVTFTYLAPPINSYSDPRNYIFFGSVRLSNGTLADLTGKGVMIEEANATGRVLRVVNNTGYGTELGDAIAVKFQDGSREVYNKFSITAVYSSGDLSLSLPHILLVYAYQPISLNPWFTEHANPRAGVFWNYTDTFTLYVSFSA